MSNSDLEKTAIVAALFRIPRKERDSVWRDALFSAIPEASMRTSEKQVITGPDGFPYFTLYLPKTGEEFEPVSLNDVLDHCVTHGLGIVFNVDKPEPDYVLTYGALWCFKTRQAFWMPPPAEYSPGLTEEIIEAERKVLVAQPSEELFPTYARKVVAHYLRESGVESPSCHLLIDSKNPEAKNIVFNIFPSAFSNKEHFNAVLEGLGWYLPSDYGCIAMDKDEGNFAPLE